MKMRNFFSWNTINDVIINAVHERTANPIAFIDLLYQPVLSMTIPTVTAPRIPVNSKIKPNMASSVAENLKGVKMLDIKVPTACMAPKGKAKATTSSIKFRFEKIALKADLKSRASYLTEATAEGGVFGFSRMIRLKMTHEAMTSTAWTSIRLLKLFKNSYGVASLSLNQ